MHSTARIGLYLLLVTVFSGCAAADHKAAATVPLVLKGGLSDEGLRNELLAFADTASARVNQLCDEVARESDRKLAEFRSTNPPQQSLDQAIAANTRVRSRTNIEKISVTNLCLQNMANPNTMSALVDMTFAFTVKGRGADRRVAAASTRPSGEDALEPWAEQFAAVYTHCSDDVWAIAMRALTRDQVDGLAQMMESYLQEHDDLRYASAKAMDLQKYVGTDPMRSSAFSLVDLKETNEQVDQIVWMSARLPDLIRLQAKQAMFDAAREAGQLREDAVNDLEASVDRIVRRFTSERIAAIDQATEAINTARSQAVNHATASSERTANEIIDRLTRQVFWWVLLPAGCLAILFLLVTIRAVRMLRRPGRGERHLPT